LVLRFLVGWARCILLPSGPDRSCNPGLRDVRRTTAQQRKSEFRRARGSFQSRVIAVFALIGLIGYLPAYADRKDFWTLDGDAIRWLGVALFTIGGVLRIYPVFVLGPRFSGLVAIQPGHTLVTSGIYRVILHPSYLGLVINSLGWALAFRSGVGVLLTALLFPPLLARIRAEEALLRSHFSGEHEAYCRRTSRLLPGIY
jgi:protein-S-isoprenylcysteine O-methyltransferase Ste14